MRAGTLKALERLFTEIMSEAEANPRFASRLLGILGETAQPADGRQSHRRSPGALDPFALYAESLDSLRRQLGKLSVEQLKDIVAEHGMDRTKLAMKWKTTARLIDLIVQTVEARAKKGDAFRGGMSSKSTRESLTMVSEEDVVDSKLEDIIRHQGRRLNIRCVRREAERYVLDAWIGNPAHPSGPRKSITIDRKDFDEVNTSAPLPPRVDAVIGRLCHALGAVPSDPKDLEMFPVFVDGIKAEALAGLLRDIVGREPNGATAEAVAHEVIEKTGSRSDFNDVLNRVRNILDHLTLRSHLGLEYRNDQYRMR